MEHLLEESTNFENSSENKNKIESDTVKNVSDTIFENIKKYTHEEYQYINLMDTIIEQGHWEQGRNGRTKGVFGHSMRFSLQNGTIPILTTKKTAWKTCLKELLWFIRGDTDNRLLQEQGVHIWDANTTREFLDSRGLTLMREGLIGPGYGYQWRNYNANYNCITGTKIVADDDKEPDIYKESITFKGVDQLQQIIDQLKDPEQRTSRRLIMTAWNPCQLDKMALPPCHLLCQFNVHDGNKLSCTMYQRSIDVMLGQPFNIASYSFLTHLLAKHCGLEAHEFIYFMGNCHIYEEHMEGAQTQRMREPFTFPTVKISQVRDNINDYEISDFEVTNYKSHDQIKMQMVA